MSEFMKPFVIMRPGGNDTCLIDGIEDDAGQRRRINDVIMSLYNTVEQVGFTDGSSRLQMAGGEFCGNATRSVASQILSGEPGELMLDVSGVTEPLAAGVTDTGEAFAQMPIYKDPSRIMTDPTTGDQIVQLEGIVQVVTFNTKQIEGLNEDQIKALTRARLTALGLDTYPAAGIMYTSQKDGVYTLEAAVVLVPAIETLFAETACGSGTTALGLVLAKQKGSSLPPTAVYQPSGKAIKIAVDFNGEVFGKATISGEVETLTEGAIMEGKKSNYAIERTRQLVDADRNALIALYKQIFSQAPYFESFTTDEVDNIFQSYIKSGILLVARAPGKVIGFGAALPLSYENEVSAVIEQSGIPTNAAWYMADLGVDDQFRRDGVGRALVQARLDAIGPGNTVIMRTSINNIASQSLYRALGFEQVIGAEQNVVQTRTDGSKSSDTRVFFVKYL